MRAQSADISSSITGVSASPDLPSATPSGDDAPGAPVDVVAASALLSQANRERSLSSVPAGVAAPAEASLPEATATVLPAAAQNIGLIMGGSGLPIPTTEYVLAAYTKYMTPYIPEGTIPEGLVTPEGLYPITPFPYVKVLPLNTSVQQGNTILFDAINQQVELGNTLSIFGYSQSAIISSLVMDPMNSQCTSTPTCGIDADTPVNFVLIGNEMNPNGGFLSRFPGLNLPSLGIPFYGATPEDSFPVTNYMREYDGFADFPQYPINFLADLNAALGIAFVHGGYLELPQEEITNAIALPTTADDQKYFVIPTAELPIATLIRAIPVIGDPIADLLEPALRTLVNLGYGDPNYGWSQGTANVETSFGVIPDVDWGETFSILVDNVVEGVHAFISDIMPGGSMWQDLSTHASRVVADVKSGLQSLADLAAGGIIPAIQSVVTNVAQFVSNAAASLYAALLPTADIANAIITMLPAYAFDLFLDGVEQILSGDVINGLINAIGKPWAAGVGLVTTASLIEVLVIKNAITSALTPVTI